LTGLGLLFYNVVAIAFPLGLPMSLVKAPGSISDFASAVVAIVGFHKLLGVRAAS